MKKILALVLICTMLCTLSACGNEHLKTYSVAMISDYADITDQSYNEAVYIGTKTFCTEKNIKFQYYKPAENNDSGRKKAIEAAIADGFNVLVLPGSGFVSSVVAAIEEYPSIYFITIDVSQGDFSGAGLTTLPENVFSAVYQEELCGYMVGQAAVRLGYKHLGFLGGMAVPAVVRYGYGFVQGINDAAKDLGLTDVVCEYAYANQFISDPDITEDMVEWYKDKGVEVVFTCGGSIFNSAAEAAQLYDGKLIGVDVDQSNIINQYGENMTLTSAMKGLGATVRTVLNELIFNDNWDAYGGTIATLGLASGTDPEQNYVQIPYETTQWGEGFTQDDYKALVADMFAGKVSVSNDIEASASSFATDIALNDYGNLK